MLLTSNVGALTSKKYVQKSQGESGESGTHGEPILMEQRLKPTHPVARQSASFFPGTLPLPTSFRGVTQRLDDVLQLFYLCIGRVPFQLVRGLDARTRGDGPQNRGICTPRQSVHPYTARTLLCPF